MSAILVTPKSDGQNYYCECKVFELNSNTNGRAFGVDSLQAIVYGINALGAALYFSEEYKNGLLSWSASRDAEILDIPVASSVADLVPLGD